MNGLTMGSLGQGAIFWAGTMGHAAGEGGLALALAWAACRAWQRMPAAGRCWLWRLAYLKLLVTLLWVTPIALPLLPPARPATGTPAAPGPAAVPMSPENPGVSSATGALIIGLPLPEVAGGLLGLWLLGVGGSLGRGLWEWRAVRCLHRQAEGVQEEAVNACCRDLCGRLGIRPAPPLLVSPAGGSPLLLGMRRPAIVVPASLLAECSLPELRLILAHELAHLRRWDLGWIWLPSLAQVLFWFHPLVWVAGQEWGLAQELACDEQAVRITAAVPADYGEVLLKVAAHCRPHPAGRWAAAGVMESYRTLRRRLIAMKTIGRVPSRRMAWIGWGLAAVGIGVLLPWRLTAAARGRTGSSPSGAATREHWSPARPMSETQQQQAEERAVGADWQQRGLLSQGDYVRLCTLGHTVVPTRALSDQDVDWLLGRMGQSSSAIVHARVMGILSTLLDPPAWQKEQINRAVMPLLRSQSALDRAYALRVVRKLGLTRDAAEPNTPSKKV